MADRSPKVLTINWGSIEIDGFGVVKDAVLQPGTAHEWDWNYTGTRHRPGIQPADVAPLVEAGAEVVVLSRGMDLQLQVMPETLTFLADRGVAVHVLETREAVALYNSLAETQPAAALIHSTC